MIKSKISIIFFTLLAGSTLTGFGVGGVDIGSGSIPDKCKGKDCAKKVDTKLVKKVVGVVAVGVAAKLIADMIIKFKSKKVKEDKQVSDDYLKKNKALPTNPKVIAYKTDIAPNSVIKAGKRVKVKSAVTVLAGAEIKTLKLEEKIEIFDSEDNSKLLKSLVKQVNKPNNQAGAYKNQFSFKFPEGMPQGVYPIKTTILINGNPVDTKDNKMQLVLHVGADKTYQLAFAH